MLAQLCVLTVADRRKVSDVAMDSATTRLNVEILPPRSAAR